MMHHNPKINIEFSDPYDYCTVSIVDEDENCNDEVILAWDRNERAARNYAVSVLEQLLADLRKR